MISDSSRQISVTSESLVQERDAARRLLHQAGLPRLFGDIDGGAYGLSHLELDILDALETALAAFIECSNQGRNFLHGGLADVPSAERVVSDYGSERFLCLFSMYAASTILLDTLARDGSTRVRSSGTFDLASVEKIMEGEADGVPQAIVQDYLRYLEFYRHHADAQKRVDRDERLLNCTRAYFGLLVNTLRTLVADSRFADFLEAVGHKPADIMGRRFSGLESAVPAASEASDLLEVSPEEIVGNDDFLHAGMRLARDVAGYDLEARQNPKRLNPVLFALGEAGCGKTITCHAIGGYFLQYCKTRDVPARFVVIRRTDWASSYQNASAQQLIDIFKSKVAAFPGVVGVYWPDIDTAFAARDDAGLRSEEKNILGACFGIFDGTIIPKNGQWFMLTDANTLNMDRATISRISQDPFNLRGPVSTDDFVRLMRDIKLKRHGEFLPLSKEEWHRLGDFCVESRLSGRSIENVTRKIISEIEDFEYPDAYFKADLARRLEIIRECSKPLDFARLHHIIDHYTRFEKEAEERARRKKFEERVKEIVFNMTAQSAAMLGTPSMMETVVPSPDPAH